MLLFMLSLAFISFIAISLLEFDSALGKKLSEVGTASAAESSARAAEVAYRCGLRMEIESRIEDKLYARAGDKLIEVDGVFYYDPSEPV
jgi:hypothetical protein